MIASMVLFSFAPAAGLLALLMAWYFYRQMLRRDEGTERMREIAGYVRDGAMAYLGQQYRIMVLVFLVVAAVFAGMAFLFELQTRWMPL